MSTGEEVDVGIKNPGLSRETSLVDGEDERTNSILDNLGSGCLQFIDDEYDEALAIPESITMSSGVIKNGTDEDIQDLQSRSNELPYLNVYNPAVKFNSIPRKVFIPGLTIHVEIIDYERQLTSHFLNPNLYTIQLMHGSTTWTVKKRYKDFATLHQQLRMFRTSLKFPLPIKNHRELRTSFRNNPNISISSNQSTSSGAKKKKKGALPRFPNKPDALVPFESIPVRIRQLEKYLFNLLSISLYREHHDTVS